MMKKDIISHALQSKKYDITLFCFHLIHTKVKDSQKSFCELPARYNCSSQSLESHNHWILLAYFESTVNKQANFTVVVNLQNTTNQAQF